MFQFFYRLKVTFRQGACALVQDPSRMKTLFLYNKIEPLEFNKGWRWISQDGTNELLRSDCQNVVDKIHPLLEKDEATENYSLSVTIKGEKIEINLSVIAAQIEIKETQHVRLDVIARRQGEIHREHMQWPLRYPEAHAKELIFLLLCKVALNKAWNGRNANQ